MLAKAAMAMDVEGADHIADVRAGANAGRGGQARGDGPRRHRLLDHNSADLLVGWTHWTRHRS